MNVMTQMATRKEQGFTLIELVMVIVILGILAAFALPRFANFGNEARVASLDGAVGAVTSGAAIAHARWVADGNNATTVSLDGVTVNMDTTNGYPEATAAGIGAAAQLDTNNYNIGTEASGVTTITLADSLTEDRDNDGNSGECAFDYNEVNGTTTNRAVDDC